MSSNGLDVQQQAQDIRRKRLEAAGLADQYDLWRESMPDQRIPDNEVYEMFMQSQVVEEAAIEGRVSVSTGGEEDILGADIPTPGPDGEEDRPDEAGDTSKGPTDDDERQTDIQPVEGMWQPPPESESENYEEPSTYQMSRSKDWVENARIVYDFMNPDKAAGLARLAGQDPRALASTPSKQLSNDDVGQWARNELSGFNWNVVNTMNYAHKITTSENPEFALAFLNLINMYDHSDGSGMEFAGALGEIATDPTTYLGLGVGSVVAKGAAKTLAKSGLKKAIQMAIVGGTAGATEGGVLAGGYNLTVQNIEQEAGAREDIDYAQAGVATGIGVGLGTLLGGVGGRFVGRRMDKFAKATADQKAADKARDKLLKNAPGMEAREAEMRAFLLDVEKGADPSKVHVKTVLAARLLDEDGQLPRLDDGSLDIEKIARVHEEVAQQEADRLKLERMRDKYPPGPDDEVGARNTPEKEYEVLEFKEAGNRLDALQEAGYKVALTEDGKHLSFEADTMAEGQYNSLKELADKHNVEIDPYQAGMKTDIEASGFPSDLDAFANDLIKAIHAEEFKASMYGRRSSDPKTIINNIVDSINTTDMDMHVALSTGKLEMVGTFEHFGGMQDVAEELGLKVVGTPRKEGFSLVVEGSDAELVDFMHKVYEVPELTPELKAQWEKILPETERQGTLREAGEPAANAAKFIPDIADEESQKFAQMVLEMKELEKGDVVMATAGRPGSRVMDELGEQYEVVGRTKNGWYHLRDNLGREKSLRRKSFEVIDKAPAPRKAGPMELDPFSKTAAKLIHMNEQIVSGKLVDTQITWKEQLALAKELQDMGIDITAKKLATHWSVPEFAQLREVYNAQGLGMADLVMSLRSQLRNEGRLLDSQLADFNEKHAMWVSTRDLFFGVSGNAARQLNILRSRPTGAAYDWSQGLMDSISIQGGRANTERAIKLMAEFAGDRLTKGEISKHDVLKNISKLSNDIWGNPTAALLLNIRYNMMLSSWRTHAFNLIGNSASGVYQHGFVSPVRMGWNNAIYARELAWSKIAPGSKYGPIPDPAERITRHQYFAEIRGHFAAARDSLFLAKEIALGRDIGEGKVWNELGLRYHVINVPDSMFAKMGTTPVRALEAGDAFFKNQYYSSKIHELSSIKARYDEVHNGLNYDKQYAHYLENADGAMQREAKAFAAKQTYTNDPNIYGGVLAAVARGVSEAQNRSLMINMIVPFVRTPANLLMFSMEMIGVQQALTPGKTYNAIFKGSARESQDALARITVAAGLWLTVQELYQNGQITGTGPSNWEERQVWMAAGWQPNSVLINGKWVSIERAAPAGQSLATIASVFDYYAMIEQQDKPAMEWIGAGLLYTADMILDESYISSATDILTAISSKETGRFRSVGASMINSTLVPNLLRDLRRPDDEAMRSSTSTNLLDQVHKQMMNATPGYLDIGFGHSSELPPTRDWKGDIKNYYGNAYQRALIPFNIRNPKDSDMASMALAYARIPVSKPNKTIAWPGGLGDSIDLFAMDNGQGFVYDKYLELMGERRAFAVNIALKTDLWKELVKEGNIGPGSIGEMTLREVLNMGSQAGRLEMLDFLIKHHGDNNMYTRPGPDGNPKIYMIQHPVSVQTYVELQKAIREEGVELTDEQKQYLIKKPIEGPEFFKP